MKSNITVEADRSEGLRRCLSPSLMTDENVSYSLEASNDCLDISFQADKLGHLRGTSDTVYRLLSLSKKILER